MASLGQWENDMKLKRDDWVRTEKGALGKVVDIHGPTVSVAIASPPEVEQVQEFLEDQLKKVDGPN
jgi:hypothetical protein